MPVEEWQLTNLINTKLIKCIPTQRELKGL